MEIRQYSLVSFEGLGLTLYWALIQRYARTKAWMDA